MSTYKKRFGHAYGALTVKSNGEDGSFFVEVSSQGSTAGVGLEAAPAVALAILEAASTTGDYVLDGSPESFMEVAVEFLRKASLAAESVAKEAADREVLEVEAMTFYFASRVGEDVTAYSSIGEMDSSVKARWVSVARKAREMHGGTK